MQFLGLGYNRQSLNIGYIIIELGGDVEMYMGEQADTHHF